MYRRHSCRPGPATMPAVRPLLFARPYRRRTRRALSPLACWGEKEWALRAGERSSDGLCNQTVPCSHRILPDPAPASQSLRLLLLLDLLLLDLLLLLGQVVREDKLDGWADELDLALGRIDRQCVEVLGFVEALRHVALEEQAPGPLVAGPGDGVLL